MSRKDKIIAVLIVIALYALIYFVGAPKEQENIPPSIEKDSLLSK